MPNPQRVVNHVLDLMGGHEKAFAFFDADFEMTSRLWNQDTEMIGRILRCHLFVEHFMGEYLGTKLPGVKLDEVRLTFAQKVALMGANVTPVVSAFLPGIRRLNSIRNRLAHTLKSDISKEDAVVFVSIPLFQAMRVEAARRRVPPSQPSSEGIVVLEDFAQHVGYSLHSVSTMNAEIWRKAIDLATAEED
jgi:hypothetical protein